MNEHICQLAESREPLHLVGTTLNERREPRSIEGRRIVEDPRPSPTGASHSCFVRLGDSPPSHTGTLCLLAI